jgi:cell wall assembly regulator SMI1
MLWGPFEDVGAADLDRVEEQIGESLPEDFRAFLLVAHGGTLPYAVRLPPGDETGELIEFSSFASLHGDWSLSRRWDNFPATFMAEHLPHGLLEVANDGGGSSLYVDLRSGTRGKVWAFVHGLPDWTGANRTDMGGEVAESWDSYLDLLTIDEDYAREVWEEANAKPDASWIDAVTEWLDSGLPNWRSLNWV